MDIKRWLVNGSITAALGMMAFVPAQSIAMTGQNSSAAQGGSGCLTANVTPQARELLNGVRRDAEQISQRTSSLESLANAPTNQQSMQESELTHIQAKVGDMNYRIDRLEEMQPSLPAADRQAINEALPMVQAMAANTTAAIADLNARIQYGGYAKTLNQEAQTLAQYIHADEHAANVQERSAYYRNNLGMLEVFGK